MAARNGRPILDLKGAVAEDLDPFHDALVDCSTFLSENNPDFRVYALHNVELVNQPSGMVLPVAFDFNFPVLSTRHTRPSIPSFPIRTFASGFSAATAETPRTTEGNC